MVTAPHRVYQRVAIGKLWYMCAYMILEDFKMDKYIYDENNGSLPVMLDICRIQFLF